MAQNKTMTDYFMHDLSITQQNIIHTHKNPQTKWTLENIHTQKNRKIKELYMLREWEQEAE